jgi:hypothetical protein
MANTKITNPELFNLGASTLATQLPVMTLVQRIAMTGMSVGEMIFNSDTDKVEYWDGTAWYSITYEAPAAENPYNAVIYTGTGNARSITGVGFEPDFVWIKNRTTGFSHSLQDTIRGTGGAATLSSDGAWAEGTYPNYGYISAFNTDGFSIGGSGGTYGYANTNQNNNNYVAWCFKAGGTAVSNTDGNLASQVSANVAGGFSIVKWSGNDTTGGTIGHGLSSTPELTIIKKTSATANWQVSLNASVTGVEGYMNLDANAALYTTYPLYYTSSNSTVLSSNGTSTATRLYNNQSANYIAYCFHSVAGFSKIGTYTGNGSTNGPTVTLGFQPTFLMCKKTTSTGNWRIMDSTRQSSNPKSKGLWANLTNAESTSTSNLVDFNLNDFQLVGGGGDVNASGQAYIYIAFA